MQEIFFTILVIWLLFRIFGQVKAHRVFTINKNPANDGRQKPGKVKMENQQASPKNKEPFGEYVDYEEIK